MSPAELELARRGAGVRMPSGRVVSTDAIENAGDIDTLTALELASLGIPGVGLVGLGARAVPKVAGLARSAAATGGKAHAAAVEAAQRQSVLRYLKEVEKAAAKRRPAKTGSTRGKIQRRDRTLRDRSRVYRQGRQGFDLYRKYRQLQRDVARVAPSQAPELATALGSFSLEALLGGNFTRRDRRAYMRDQLED